MVFLPKKKKKNYQLESLRGSQKLKRRETLNSVSQNNDQTYQIKQKIANAHDCADKGLFGKSI